MRLGSIVRTACGSRIVSSVWVRVSPTAYAASAWPRGRDASPARRISAMIAML